MSPSARYGATNCLDRSARLTSASITGCLYWAWVDILAIRHVCYGLLFRVRSRRAGTW